MAVVTEKEKKEEEKEEEEEVVEEEEKEEEEEEVRIPEVEVAGQVHILEYPQVASLIRVQWFSGRGGHWMHDSVLYLVDHMSSDSSHSTHEMR